MKLFVYEHITSGAYAGDTLPENLVHEGQQMWLSALRDCAQTTACSITALHDSRMSPPALLTKSAHHQYYSISDSMTYQQRWQQCLSECDAALIIAPETDNCLLSLQRQVEQAGKINLGSSTKAIQLTSDKLACAQHLIQADIKTIPTYSISDWQQHAFASTTGYIVKPSDGAGCSDTYFMANQSSLSAHLTSHQHSQTIIQPYQKGINASLSILVSQQKPHLLSINHQHITIAQNQLTLSACRVNSDHPALPSRAEAQLIAEQVHQAIPGLNGFFGLDLVCDEDNYWVVDINPRLTSSYCALNTHFNLNPMQYLIAEQQGHQSQLPSLSHQQHVTITL